MENTWKKLPTWLITIGCICHLGPKFASGHNTFISSFPVVGVSPVDFLVCTFCKAAVCGIARKTTGSERMNCLQLIDSDRSSEADRTF